MLTNANSFFLLINIKNNAEYMKFHNIAVLITKNVRGVAISSGHNNECACAGLRESEREISTLVCPSFLFAVCI